MSLCKKLHELLVADEGSLGMLIDGLQQQSIKRSRFSGAPVGRRQVPAARLSALVASLSFSDGEPMMTKMDLHSVLRVISVIPDDE